MERMTPEERVAYSHGRINRDLGEFEEYISRMRRQLKQSMDVWVIAMLLSGVGLIATIMLSGISDWRDYVFIGFVVVTFTVLRAISYVTLTTMIQMADGLMRLFARLADDLTLKYGFEEMMLETTPPPTPPLTSTSGEGGEKADEHA